MRIDPGGFGIPTCDPVIRDWLRPLCYRSQLACVGGAARHSSCGDSRLQCGLRRARIRPEWKVGRAAAILAGSAGSVCSPLRFKNLWISLWRRCVSAVHVSRSYAHDFRSYRQFAVDSRKGEKRPSQAVRERAGGCPVPLGAPRRVSQDPRCGARMCQMPSGIPSTFRLPGFSSGDRAASRGRKLSSQGSLLRCLRRVYPVRLRADAEVLRREVPAISANGRTSTGRIDEPPGAMPSPCRRPYQAQTARSLQLSRSDAGGVRKGPLRRPDSRGGLPTRYRGPAGNSLCRWTGWGHAPKGVKALQRAATPSGALRTDGTVGIALVGRALSRVRFHGNAPPWTDRRASARVPAEPVQEREPLKRTRSFTAPEGVGTVPAHLAAILGSTRDRNIVPTPSFYVGDALPGNKIL